MWTPPTVTADQLSKMRPNQMEEHLALERLKQAVVRYDDLHLQLFADRLVSERLLEELENAEKECETAKAEVDRISADISNGQRP